MIKFRWALVAAAAALLAGSVCFLGKSGFEEVSGPKMEKEEVCRLIMQWPASGEVPPGLKDVEEAVSQITRERIGAEIEFLPVNGGSLSSATSFSVSSGEQIDLCVSVYQGLEHLVNAGCLLPLEELIDTYAKDLRKVCGVQLTGGYYQGKLYGIPVVYSNGTRQGFLCRTDILEKYDFDL